MNRRWTILLAGFAGVVLGCAGDAGGGGSGAALDCAYLAGPDNCWKAQLAVVKACTVPRNASGRLSADRRVCTYDDGHVITFDEPLAVPVDSDHEHHLTVNNGGADCVRFDGANAKGVSIRTSAGTVKLGPTGSGTSAVLTCPDGSTHATSDVLSLARCGPGGSVNLELFPGVVFQNAGAAGGIDLGGGGPGSKQVPLFLCE